MRERARAIVCVCVCWVYFEVCACAGRCVHLDVNAANACTVQPTDSSTLQSLQARRPNFLRPGGRVLGRIDEPPPKHTHTPRAPTPCGEQPAGGCKCRHRRPHCHPRRRMRSERHGLSLPAVIAGLLRLHYLAVRQGVRQRRAGHVVEVAACTRVRMNCWSPGCLYRCVCILILQRLQHLHACVCLVMCIYALMHSAVMILSQYDCGSAPPPGGIHIEPNSGNSINVERLNVNASTHPPTHECMHACMHANACMHAIGNLCAPVLEAAGPTSWLPVDGFARSTLKP